MQVFISYKRENQTYAELLRDVLRSWSYTPWLDVEQIDTGTYWPDEIDKGLRQSELVLGIVSPAAVQSRNVKNEWDWALMNDKPLILLLIEPCILPHRYISINYIDATTNRDAAFTHLRHVLHNPKEHPQYQDEDVPLQQSPDDVSQFSASIQQDNRTRMLRNVRQFWIEGILNNALASGDSLTIQLNMTPSAVLKHPNYGDYNFPETSLDILQIFEDMNRDLLILGTPGSGKTILLLQLAEELLHQAEVDKNAQIPVVFNLSSWAAEQLPLDAWLTNELRRKYQVPAKVAHEWVEREQLLLLLDGLDEVAVAHRSDCVDAINNFRQTYRLVDMVVCSRIADYENLSQKLDLQGAITLQALSDEQVNQYIASGSYSALSETLQTDSTLRKLSRTPFLLNTMAFAYRDATRLQLRLTTHDDNAQGRLHHLFDIYVDRRIKDKASESPYIPRETRHYLDWLGSQMVKHNQTIFYIEHIQPNWLGKAQETRYQLLSLVAIGGIGGMLLGLFVTILTTILSLVIIAIFFTMQNMTLPTFDIIMELLTAVFVFGGLPIASTMFITSVWNSIQHGGGTKVEDAVVWRLTRASILWGILGVVLGAIAGQLLFATITSPITWIVAAVAGGITFPFMHGFRSTERVQMRINPNQGMWQTVLTRLRISTVVGFVLGSVASISTFIYLDRVGVFLAGRLSNTATALIVGLMVGIGFMMVIFASGIALFGRHLLMRYLLVRQQYMPMRYADFLDYAAHELLILRKVGGGYMFWHRYLLEYFAGESMD